jgi:citrate lyase beta subunit
MRSVLFVPAGNGRAIEKSKQLRPDALIFDLEDAVGPDEKDAALGNLVAALAAGGFQTPRFAVRINTDTLDEIVDALRPFIQDGLIKAVVVPKVKYPADLAAVASHLPSGTPLWAMIETAMGAVNLKDISATVETLPLEALILGPNDLRAELRSGRSPERMELQHIMGALVLHARAYGLMALDGVYNAHKDQAGFERECQQGKLLGFDGKTLIHPAQIEPCDVAFGPTEAELGWAQRVVAAFALPENAGLGVISLDGEMIERLHLERARILLAQAERDR